MPVQAHTRATISGEFRNAAGSPVEIWSWGLKFGALGTSPADSNADQVAAAALLRSAYSQHLAPYFRSWVVATRFRVSQHVAGGLTAKLTNGAYHQADDLTAVPGTGTGGSQEPLQTALCLSLLTPAAGSSGKGRVFLPWPQYAVSPDFTITAAQATSMATAFAAYLKALRPSLGDARVYSYKGTNAVVQSVRAGVVPDTMRSRRGALLEKYVSVPIPA